MKIEVLADAEAVARAGAALVAAEARTAVAARGRFVVAVSGGHTPWAMLRTLASEPLPWAGVHVVQVDERVAPPGDPDRNLTHLRDTLLAHAPLPPDQLHAMPVEDADLAAAAQRYAQTLREVAGTPPVLDLVHLGLGPDGHTASLFPGDPGLDADPGRLVLATRDPNGRNPHPRLTLTLPAINSARLAVFTVAGASKADAVAALLRGEDLPAARVHAGRTIWLVDGPARAAAP